MALAAKHFSFRGTTSQGLNVSFQVPYSFLAVTKFNIDWTAKCSSGATLQGSTKVGRITLTADRRGRMRWKSIGSYAYTGVDPRYSASGMHPTPLTFTVAVVANTGTLPTNPRASGKWSTTTVVTDSTTHQLVDKCSSGTVKWTASLA